MREERVGVPQRAIVAVITKIGCDERKGRQTMAVQAGERVDVRYPSLK